jgi:hypothetical protein
MSSCDKNQRALKAFTEDFIRNSRDTQAERPWRNFCRDILLNNEGFWNPLESLLQIIRPISESQKMSESSSASVAYVFERWLKTVSHLNNVVNSSNHFADAIQRYKFDPAWVPTRGHTPGHFREDKKSLEALRLDQQLTPIHVLAYFLVPDNYEQILLPKYRDQIYEAIKQYCPNYDECFNQFLRFREHSGEFHVSAAPITYSRVHNPKDFWIVYKIEVPELASLALRLLNTPANSVPAEKSFSAMNRIQDEDRNAMAPEKCNKATHVAMNERAFARAAILSVGEIEVMAIALENTLIEDSRAQNSLKRKRDDTDDA